MLKRIRERIVFYCCMIVLFLGLFYNISSEVYANDDYPFIVNQWLKIDDNLYTPLVCKKGNNIITYEYDDKFNRIQKNINGNITLYMYEEYFDKWENIRYRIIRETNDDVDIEYVYDNNFTSTPVGITINGENFFYKYDRSGYITDIYNNNNKIVTTYKYGENGSVWVIYDEGIADYNSMLYNALYIDKESGYSYCEGVYSDVRNNILVNEFSNIECSEPINNIYNDLKKIMQKMGLPFNFLENGDVYSQYAADVNYAYNYYIYRLGAAVNDYDNGNWYKKLSEVDSIARTIYGEYGYCKEISSYSGDYYSQRLSIMWVINNRLKEKGGCQLIDIVTQKDQFHALTGSHDEVDMAMKPDPKHSSWKESVLIATYIWQAYNGYYGDISADKLLLSTIGRPERIETQKYFVSKKSWAECYRASDNTFKFKNSSVYKEVTNLAFNVGNIQENQKRNIFFNLQ